jgi:hypothetical protein
MGGSGPICPTKPDDAPCTKCLNQSCCKELRECAFEPQCLKLLQCIMDCPANDDACDNNCLKMYPDGFTPLSAITGCTRDHCEAACTDTPGTGGSGAPPGGTGGRVGRAERTLDLMSTPLREAVRGFQPAR